MAQVESVLVEGKIVKVLCMDVGENKISVFMEKTATHAWIIKRIRL
jgi:predicted regulator of Ras-like GTPase activity (Roadblock/LC7/MglB family)